MKTLRVLAFALACLGFLVGPVSSAQAACNAVIWADGNTDSGGNGIDAGLNSIGCTTTFATNADLDTPGFLDPFNVIVVTRSGDVYGTSMDTAGAMNVKTFVAGNGTPGRVLLFLNDWLDNIPFNQYSDPKDTNTSGVGRNAVLAAAASGHGYVGELNGASMALASNDDGFVAIGLFPAQATRPIGGITCDSVTQINSHHVGIGSFTPLDQSCYGINTTGFDLRHIIYKYTTSGEPAVVDNYPLSAADAAIQATIPITAPSPSRKTTDRRTTSGEHR